MSNLNLDPSQLGLTDLKFILILLVIGIIGQKVFLLLRFIRSLKSEKELKAIIAHGVTRNTSIIGVLGLESIIFFVSLYLNQWSLLNTIKNPIAIMYLTIPLINFVAEFGLYYIKVWYLSRMRHANVV